MNIKKTPKHLLSRWYFSPDHKRSLIVSIDDQGIITQSDHRLDFIGQRLSDLERQYGELATPMWADSELDALLKIRSKRVPPGRT